MALALLVAVARAHALKTHGWATLVDTELLAGGSAENFTVLTDTDLDPGDAGTQIAVKPGSSAIDCATQCLAMPDCVAIVWNGPKSKYHDRKCGFKCSVTHRVADPGEQAVIVRPNLGKCTPLPRPPSPPPPPPPPAVLMPADWAPGVHAAEMLYGALASLDPLPLYPNIGNGYFGGTLGCFPSTCGEATGALEQRARSQEGGTNCVVSGVLRIAGVYTGAGTRSVRAALPAVHSVFVTRAGGEPVEFAGSALDMQNATVLNRTKLLGCGGRVLEQRWYAHRALRSVLVYEMELLGAGSTSPSDAATEECVVELSSCNQITTNDVDVASQPTKDGAAVDRNCTTKAPESVQAPLVTVAMRFQPVGANVTLLQGQTKRFVASMRTSLPDDGAARPSAAAAADFAAAVSLSPVVLHRSHAAAWAQLRQSRVELGPPLGDDGHQWNASSIGVAAAVNSSFYAILSSIRDDWAGGFGTSPGGLANSAYEGHTFWDMEEWHYPALAPLYPELGRQMMSYRSSRLKAAQAEAQAFGQVGARYPIESGLLGREVCRSAGIAEHELHTTGDVAMAHRLQYRVTRNSTWLAESWPVIESCAQFWAGRVTACNQSTHPNNFTVLSVIGSDERAGIVDDNAYTNALVAETLAYAAWVADQVGAAPSANWSRIAAGMLLPVVDGIFDGGPIHLENRQYKAGQMISQSDVGLLQYPLGQDMPQELKANDLTYWENHTLDNGFYTGDSSYAIAWMAIGRRDMSDAQFFRAFSYQNGLAGTRYAKPAQYNPFNVWKERALEGGHLNFLTGAGGFIQNVVQGYAGWRAHATRLDFRPVLPPFTGLVRLVGLKYAGATFTLEYTATSVTVELLAAAGGAGAAGLAVDILAGNASSVRHGLKHGVPLSLPAGQAFSVVAM
jgi:hypothetical protein